MTTSTSFLVACRRGHGDTYPVLPPEPTRPCPVCGLPYTQPVQQTVTTVVVPWADQQGELL